MSLIYLFYRYYEIEWRLRNGTSQIFDEKTLPCIDLTVPQQPNSCDCGIYMLQFIEEAIRTRNPTKFNPNVFRPEIIAQKREDIIDVIRIINKEQMKESNRFALLPDRSEFINSIVF